MDSYRIIATESFKYCDDSDLKRLGYRKKIFDKHKYIFIYRVIDDIVVVEAVYHQLQDYENLFAEEIGIR